MQVSLMCQPAGEKNALKEGIDFFTKGLRTETADLSSFANSVRLHDEIIVSPLVLVTADILVLTGAEFPRDCFFLKTLIKASSILSLGTNWNGKILLVSETPAEKISDNLRDIRTSCKRILDASAADEIIKNLFEKIFGNATGGLTQKSAPKKPGGPRYPDTEGEADVPFAIWGLLAKGLSDLHQQQEMITNLLHKTWTSTNHADLLDVKNELMQLVIRASQNMQAIANLKAQKYESAPKFPRGGIVGNNAN